MEGPDIMALEGDRVCHADSEIQAGAEDMAFCITLRPLFPVPSVLRSISRMKKMVLRIDLSIGSQFIACIVMAVAEKN